ncbi:hypothetical protein TREAZ_3299 [Leadbettera azotonutricia ZAS-9]|uniref:Uncharacterized protein n=1 Tax=Leadbettera azotonutricia (strain ATCC BAA-888 / DSM 13862 / ZAS-9) TaxID=545695 RepID=F5Y923_LEAAZ|nr:hypothetical protein TREAZ_3299 [Leadbettera azotonutricia ZAS-9]
MLERRWYEGDCLIHGSSLLQKMNLSNEKGIAVLGAEWAKGYFLGLADAQ